jgi:FkbM family methyltransferase
MSGAAVEFSFEGQTIRFEAVAADEHILQAMRRLGTFYELDVLDAIRESSAGLEPRGGALDIGAFIGTHSVFFAKYCGFAPVIAFEPNPVTFPFLARNLAANDVSRTVLPVALALGARAGLATVVAGSDTNRASASVDFDAGGPTQVSTVDIEVGARPEPIGLMKIDVEGAELAVLAGAAGTIERHRPLLCIELHTAARVRRAMAMLAGYWIVDCRGWSPTYLIEPTSASAARRAIVNAVWILRAALPSTLVALRWYLRRLARWLAGVPERRPPRASTRRVTSRGTRA